MRASRRRSAARLDGSAALRQRCARPVAEALHAWMVLQRARVNEGSSIAKALDYSLRRWAALTRYLDDPQLPVDNNWCENQVRLIALAGEPGSSRVQLAPAGVKPQ
ncbi:hypothetical protein AXG89_41675 (plasmid) [Burkholderia sp. PAMC 26561]|nr:hypothetical protein AXG89_41675 [Burkholderia sp. PAMC 26561]